MRFIDDNMRKLLHFSFVFFIVCNFVTLAGCQTKEGFDSSFKKCQKLSEEKETEKAIICFEEAVRLNPEDASSYIYLADEYKELNQLEKAEEAIKKAISLRPQTASAHGTYGEILELKGNLQEALKERQQAVKLQPKVGIYWIDLAFTQEKLNKFTDAIESYNEALAINPNDTATLYFSGLLYERTGNLDKAIENLERYNKVKSGIEEIEQKLETLKKQRELERLKNKPKKKAKAA